MDFQHTKDIDESMSSKSRFGRTRRPKILEDFCHIDDLFTSARKQKSPEKNPLKSVAATEKITAKNHFILNKKDSPEFNFSRKVFKPASTASKVTECEGFGNVINKVAELEDCFAPAEKRNLKTYSNKNKTLKERPIFNILLPDDSKAQYFQELDIQANTEDINIHENKLNLFSWESLGEAKTSNVPMEDLFIRDEDLENLVVDNNNINTENKNTACNRTNIKDRIDISHLSLSPEKMLNNDAMTPKRKRIRKKRSSKQHIEDMVSPRRKEILSPKVGKNPRLKSPATKEVLSELKDETNQMNKSKDSSMNIAKSPEMVEHEILSPRALRAMKKKLREESLEKIAEDFNKDPLGLEATFDGSREGRSRRNKSVSLDSPIHSCNRKEGNIDNEVLERLNNSQNREEAKSEEPRENAKNSKFETAENIALKIDKNDESLDKSDNKILEIDKKLNIDTNSDATSDEPKTDYNRSHSYNSDVDIKCTKDNVKNHNSSSDVAERKETCLGDHFETPDLVNITSEILKSSTPRNKIICKINIEGLSTVIYKDHSYFNGSGKRRDKSNNLKNEHAIMQLSGLADEKEVSSESNNDSNESINLDKIFTDYKSGSKDMKPKVLVEVLNEDLYSLPEQTNFLRTSVDKKLYKSERAHLLKKQLTSDINHFLNENNGKTIKCLDSAFSDFVSTRKTGLIEQIAKENNNEKIVCNEKCSPFPMPEVKIEESAVDDVGFKEIKVSPMQDDEIPKHRDVMENGYDLKSKDLFLKIKSELNVEDIKLDVKSEPIKTEEEVQHANCNNLKEEENISILHDKNKANNKVSEEYNKIIDTQDILDEIEKILEPCNVPPKISQELASSVKEIEEIGREDKENLDKPKSKFTALESPRTRRSLVKADILINVNAANKETLGSEKNIPEAEQEVTPTRILRSRKAMSIEDNKLLEEKTKLTESSIEIKLKDTFLISPEDGSNKVEIVVEDDEMGRNNARGKSSPMYPSRRNLRSRKSFDKLKNEDSTTLPECNRTKKPIEEGDNSIVVEDITHNETQNKVEAIGIAGECDEAKLDGILEIKEEPKDQDEVMEFAQIKQEDLTGSSPSKNTMGIYGNSASEKLNSEPAVTESKLDDDEVQITQEVPCVINLDDDDGEEQIVMKARLRKSIALKEPAVAASRIDSIESKEDLELDQLMTPRNLRSRKLVDSDRVSMERKSCEVAAEVNGVRRKSTRLRNSMPDKKLFDVSQTNEVFKKRKLADCSLDNIMDDVEFIRNSLKDKPEFEAKALEEMDSKRIKLDPEVVIKQEVEEDVIAPTGGETKEEADDESKFVKLEVVKQELDSDKAEMMNLIHMCSKGLHKFKNGDLAYAKLGKCPYWPCLVIKDPSTKKFTNSAPSGKQEALQYHIRFFGDRGRRSWVKITNLLPFSMNLHRAYAILKNQKIMDRVVAIDFFKVSRFPKWFVGMREATSLVNKTVLEREAFFKGVLAKEMEIKEQLKKERSAKKGKEEAVLNKVAEDVPQETEGNYSLRKRKSDTKQDDSSVEEVKAENESLSESQSETDSIPMKWTIKTPIAMNKESQQALCRRNNLFRGLRRERVCQICYLPGDVLKCRGKCYGHYHKSCAIDTNRTVKVVRKGKFKLVNETTGNEVEVVTIKSKKYQSPKNLSLDKDMLSDLTLSEHIDFKMKEIMNPLEAKTIYADSTTDSSSEENSAAHVEVLETSLKSDEFRCGKCLANIDPPCHMCGCNVSPQGSSARQRCTAGGCGKTFHQECLRLWPQTQFSLTKNSNDELDSFCCPMHVCHICVSDNPRALHARISANKIARCLKCPATYHCNSRCIPAGTNMITAKQIICPRHFVDSRPTTVNTTWCFICSKGGALICCETCPTSVHSECSSINYLEDGTFVCEDCESGRLPLYDEIVWAKLGSYRWWPALILFPNEIPENVMSCPHHEGQFVVRFFGTHDHYWIGRGRVFLFQEDDATSVNTNKFRSRVDFVFQQAINEAAEAHKFKEEYREGRESLLKESDKPPTFIRIKINRPLGSVKLGDASNTSNAMACTCDPDGPNPCGESSDCLNRMLLTECDLGVCPAGERCENQRFDKRQYAKVIPYRTKGRGWGLRTLEPIKKGQFVIEYVGEVIDDKEYQRRIKKMHEQKIDNYYFLTIDNCRMIDAGPKGNLARFMNHCCEPNCETQKWTVHADTRIGLFACEDIPKDTELTFNYNFQCVGEEKKECRCGAPSCSGFIGAKKTVIPTKPKKQPLGKPATPSPEPAEEELCFECGETGLGETYPCHNRMCTKYYHPKCVNLKTKMSDKWTCPWHNCNVCAKRTIRCCLFCTTSYCPLHAEGAMRHDKMLGYLCSSHDPEMDVANHSEGLQKPKSPTDESDVTSTTYEADDSASSITEDSCHGSGVKPPAKGKKRSRTSRSSLTTKKRMKRAASDDKHTSQEE